MDRNFIVNRLTQLRLARGVSERKMSLDLGHSTSYVRSITSGRAMPSMLEFLYICEYLKVTPQEFFDEGHSYSVVKQKIITRVNEMSEREADTLLKFIDVLDSTT